MIKLRISDSALHDLAYRYGTDDWYDTPDLRRDLESAGIEAPAVTVEELTEVISYVGMALHSGAAARAVLELMQRRTLPDDSARAALESACDGYRATIARLESELSMARFELNLARSDSSREERW